MVPAARLLKMGRVGGYRVSPRATDDGAPDHSDHWNAHLETVQAGRVTLGGEGVQSHVDSARSFQVLAATLAGMNSTRSAAMLSPSSMCRVRGRLVSAHAKWPCASARHRNCWIRNEVLETRAPFPRWVHQELSHKRSLVWEGCSFVFVVGSSANFANCGRRPRTKAWPPLSGRVALGRGHNLV